MNATRHTDPFALGSARWESVLDEVRDLDKFQPDWDGEGADVVSFDMIRQTRRWLEALQLRGDPAPACAYPLADGTVMVEWHYGPQSAVSANVRDGGRVEIVVRELGKKPTFSATSLLELLGEDEPAVPGATPLCFDNWSDFPLAA